MKYHPCMFIGNTSGCFHVDSTMELKETTKTAKEGGNSDKSEVIEKPNTVAFADEVPKTAM